MTWSLAIDVGTSFTSAAVRVEDKVVDVEFRGQSTVPSVAAVQHDGRTIVGFEAAAFASQFPERAERLPKRALARRRSLRIGHMTVEPVTLVSALLAYVAMHAKDQHGRHNGVLERVVLTHPVQWRAATREALLAAARGAGLFNVELMAESVAAGRGFLAERRVAPGGRVAVYDLGGGTFDTAVLHRTESGFSTDGSVGGNEQLGGEDFDDRLRELIAQRAAAVDADRWHAIWAATSGPDARAQLMLRQDLVQAKEHLSIANSTGIYTRGFSTEWIVTRPEFETVIQPVVQQTVDLLADTIDRSGVTPVEELSAIYLTGGASRTPLVRALLQRRFPVRIQTADLPKLAVARGALADLPPVPTPAPLVTTTIPGSLRVQQPTGPATSHTQRSPDNSSTTPSGSSGSGDWVAGLLMIGGGILVLLVGISLLGAIIGFLGELF